MDFDPFYMSQPRNSLPAWSALEDHAHARTAQSINDLFTADPDRFDCFHQLSDGLLIDYSKNNITDETIKLLCDYARACQVEEMRDAMFSGAKINITEDRAVLHTALRDREGRSILVDGQDIDPVIKTTAKKMRAFCMKMRQDRRFRHIVNIGIGGSDLGPMMAYEALAPYHDAAFDVHFVSNIDPTHLAQILNKIDAEKTLFIVTSKTFSTMETLANAKSAREWLRDTLGDKTIDQHFAAVTANPLLAKDFGVCADQIFPTWNWVGGRFSVWSAVGLALSIGVGFEHFSAFLDGAHAMDQHFQTTPLEQNMPALLGMIGMWNRNFLNYTAFAVSPYDQHLKYFPAYMQQIDMESNGKSVDRFGRKVDYATGPVVLGEVGTNAQHAFFQLFHQGTEIVPCDLIIIATTQNPMGDQHQRLVSNALAQGQALMQGRAHEDMSLTFDGGRPTNTLIIDSLTPFRLGQLLALYEHKIFVQGVLWNINSFDQCGVELGKSLVKPILTDLSSEDDLFSEIHDSSTEGLLRHLRMINRPL